MSNVDGGTGVEALALHAGRGQSVLDVALDEQEHKHDWQRGQNGCRCEQGPISRELIGDEGLQPKRQRMIGRVVEEDRGDHIFAVSGNKGEHEDNGKLRSRQRQDDAQEHDPVAGSGDKGRLVKLLGDRIDISLEQPDVEGAPSGQHEHQRQQAVRQAKLVDEDVEARYRHAAREYLEDEQGEQSVLAAGEAHAREGIPRRACQKQLEDRHPEANFERVDDPGHKVRLCQQTRVIARG